MRLGVLTHIFCSVASSSQQQCSVGISMFPLRHEQLLSADVHSGTSSSCVAECCGAVARQGVSREAFALQKGKRLGNAYSIERAVSSDARNVADKRHLHCQGT
jgi:hypothetical protein